MVESNMAAMDAKAPELYEWTKTKVNISPQICHTSPGQQNYEKCYNIHGFCWAPHHSIELQLIILSMKWNKITKKKHNTGSMSWL